MIRGRQSQMLNKKQEKILFWITGIVVVFLVFISVFIWPNFYIQYRMAKGVTISDVTSSEREIINEHIDCQLPQSATIISISTTLRPMEQPFCMTFSMPLSEQKHFIEPISDVYQFNALENVTGESITVSGKEQKAVHFFKHISKEFTGIYEYASSEETVYFQLIYTDISDDVDNIFYERVRIMPKWLDFH